MDMLTSLFDSFVEEARLALKVDGASAELSTTGALQKFLEKALATVSEKQLHLIPQTMTDPMAVGFKGFPDFRINDKQELLGWLEFKAVRDKDITNLRSKHDKQQKETFTSGLQNLIYTNGHQWELWQNSENIATVEFDAGLFNSDAHVLSSSSQIIELEHLLTLFTSFQLQPYKTIHKAVSALALRARAMKIALNKIGASKAGPYLTQLRDDFKGLLYRNGQPFTWANFVDSYVQISAFGALLWRLEARTEIGLDQHVGLKQGVHPLLYRCLSILWQKEAQVENLTPVLEELVRTINLIPLELFEPKRKGDEQEYSKDPIIHAYEPFFEAYDKDSRESSGVYYTPAELVQHIVNGVENLIIGSLGRKDGLLDENARFLDPATGTGTFLLGLAKEVERSADNAGLITENVISEVLTQRTSAFELFPGPYTIAHQRVEALLRRKGTPPEERLPIYLTDTLAGPEVNSLYTSGFGVAGKEIEEERFAADRIKTEEDILAIIGNPPWERLQKRNGGWDTFATTLMKEVTNATPPNRRKDLKSATDLFVAFWAWSLWALQDTETRQLPEPVIDTSNAHGIVAFVTNRTWIVGPSLIGLRNLVLKGVKEVWVYDLGGDVRGGSSDFLNKDNNVFNIQTGAAIVWLVFNKEYSGEPTVRYRRSSGRKAEKLHQLSLPFNRDDYEIVDGKTTFMPGGYPEALLRAPELPDLFDFEPYTGFQSGRDTKEYSPLGIEAADVYAEIKSPNREKINRIGTLGRWAGSELTDTQRELAWRTAAKARAGKKAPAISSLTPSKVQKIQYRPLDERHIYNDPAWIDWYRESLQDIYNFGETPTIISLPRDFGRGPLTTYTQLLPDQHAFNNRGGKAVFPLYKVGTHGREIGLSETVMKWAEKTYNEVGEPAAEKAFNYILAFLSATDYTEEFWTVLEASPPTVILSENRALAEEGAIIGEKLRAAWNKDVEHEGFRWGGSSSTLELGKATWKDDHIHFANQRWISGVDREIWDFSVSKYKVVQKYFAARQSWQQLSISQSLDALNVLASIRELLGLFSQANNLFHEVVSLRESQIQGNRTPQR